MAILEREFVNFVYFITNIGTVREVDYRVCANVAYDKRKPFTREAANKAWDILLKTYPGLQRAIDSQGGIILLTHEAPFRTDKGETPVNSGAFLNFMSWTSNGKACYSFDDYTA